MEGNVNRFPQAKAGMTEESVRKIVNSSKVTMMFPFSIDFIMIIKANKVLVTSATCEGNKGLPRELGG